MFTLKKAIIWIMMTCLLISAFATSVQAQEVNAAQLIEAWSQLNQTLDRGQSPEQKRVTLQIYATSLRAEARRRANANDQSSVTWRLANFRHKLMIIMNTPCDNARTVLTTEEVGFNQGTPHHQAAQDAAQALKILNSLCN